MLTWSSVYLINYNNNEIQFMKLVFLRHKHAASDVTPLQFFFSLLWDVKPGISYVKNTK